MKDGYFKMVMGRVESLETSLRGHILSESQEKELSEALDKVKQRVWRGGVNYRQTQQP